MPLGKSYRYLLQPLRDAVANRRYASAAGTRILVLRDATDRPTYYRQVLEYLADAFPSVRACLELSTVWSPIRHWDRYALCTAWVQDPVKERRPSLYRGLKAIERRCATRGIPVMTPVDALSNSVKSTAARLIAGTGCRAARVQEVRRDTLVAVGEELGYPLFIRENRQHQGPMQLVRSPDDGARVAWAQFRHPVAVQFIDTIGPDGLYRKYRSILAGTFRTRLHMMVSREWAVRQQVEIVNDATIREEAEFRDDEERHAPKLEAVRRALGFDFCAFDYSVDQMGALVVWEANPYPYLPLKDKVRHRYGAMRRAYAVMAGGHLQRAGLAVPEALLKLVGRR